MPTPVVEGGSPVSPTRTTSIRKLARILRPNKTRQLTVPALSIPGDRLTPPSSPSLYSLSSDGGDSRSKLIPDTDRVDARPLFSPTSSTFSASASEGHGDLILGGVDNDQGPISSSEPSPKFQRSPSADYAWPTNKAYAVRPQRIIIADTDDGIITNGSSLRAGRWVERAKLQPLSPSEWIGSNVLAKKMFLGVAQLSPVESENRSPISSSSSPATPRLRPVPEIPKPRGDFDKLDTTLHANRNQTIPEISDSELLTELRQRPRPRSASEPRSFLALGAAIETPKHAESVPSTPTAYIFTVPFLDSTPRPSSPKHTVSPPPRQSSLPSSPARMPEDVYFTAAGRRESRMYISPDAAPNFVPAVPLSPPPRRGHAHSNSEPLLLTESSPATRYATWTGVKSMKEPTSGRPFENVTQETASTDGESTPVSRKEEMWSGTWNRDDIQDVIRELRSLK